MQHFRFPDAPTRCVLYCRTHLSLVFFFTTKAQWMCIRRKLHKWSSPAIIHVPCTTLSITIAPCVPHTVTHHTQQARTIDSKVPYTLWPSSLKPAPGWFLMQYRGKCPRAHTPTHTHTHTHTHTQSLTYSLTHVSSLLSCTRTWKAVHFLRFSTHTHTHTHTHIHTHSHTL